LNKIGNNILVKVNYLVIPVVLNIFFESDDPFEITGK